MRNTLIPERELALAHHLTLIDYRTMPWANGLGKTVELINRVDDGNLLWRLSMATITEDGPFSAFPGIERNLTIFSGEGFDLVEDDSGFQYSASLLTPVTFSGDTPVTAKNVVAPCEGFNVMTRSDLPKPKVWVEHNNSEIKTIASPQLALFAISLSTVKTIDDTFRLKPYELLLCQKTVQLQEGKLICVALNDDYIN